MGLAMLIVVLDQASKQAIVRWIGPDARSHHQPLVGRLVSLDYVENSGIAFGMFQGHAWLLSVAAVLVAAGFVAIFWTALPYDRVVRLSTACIVGGALGNLVDRLRQGYVVDFVAVGSWHRFNVADSSITIGLLLLAWATLPRDMAGEHKS